MDGGLFGIDDEVGEGGGLGSLVQRVGGERTGREQGDKIRGFGGG